MAMKRIFVVAAVVCLGALLYGAFGYWPNTERSVVASTPPVNSEVAVLNAQSDQTNKSDARLGLPALSKSLTFIRASILDSDDIVAAALLVASHGTPDEKSYAADALRSCNQLISQRTIPEDVRVQIAAARGQEAAEVRVQREVALSKIDKQCSGFQAMTAQQRLDFIQNLRSASTQLIGGVRSAHQTAKELEGRIRNGDTRLSSVEVQIISNSLHGEDSILRREAFDVLLSSMDRKAPGGNERTEALLRAMASDIKNPVLSKFEGLEACSYMGLCSSESFASFVVSGEASEPSAEMARLMRLYRNAFDKRSDYNEIMAIR